MPTIQVEMLWDCSRCQATMNRGLEKHCRHCGHPKDERDREYMPETVTEQDALTDDKKRRAEAGADWKCKYCVGGPLQNQLNKCCTECGVPKDQGAIAREAKEAPPAVAVYHPVSGQRQAVDASLSAVASAWKSHARGQPSVSFSSSDTPTTMPVSSDASDAPNFMSRATKWKAVAVPAAAVLVGLVLWLVFRTKTYDVRVTGLHWEHKVLIDRYQVWHRDGWDPDPTAFDVRDDGPRVHHYDHVHIGSHDEPYIAHEECGQDCRTVHGTCSKTPRSCRSNKNGTATCTGGDRVCSPDTKSCTTRYCDVPRKRKVDDYEDQPRYREYYDWSVWEWGYNRTVARSGSTTDESWPSDDELALNLPSLNDGEREREAVRKVTHRVTFSDGNGGEWAIEPEACQQFEGYPLGGAWKVKVGVAHGVEVLPR
jgi:hypothetical protein